MKCILHLGLPKTATTSLQTSIFPHLPDLALFVRDGPAATLEYVRYSAAEAAKRGQSEAAYLDKIRAKLAAGLQSQTAGTVLISNENVLAQHPDGPAALVRRIHHACPDASAFIVLREPVSFLKSIYRQEIDSYVAQMEEGRAAFGGIKPFQDFIAAALKLGARGHLGFIHYNEIVAELIKCYGPEKTLVLDFNLVAQAPDVFVRRILNFIDKPWGDSLALERHNVSTAKMENLPERLAKCGLTDEQAARLLRSYENLELPGNIAAALDDYVSLHANATWIEVSRPS